MFKKLIGTTSVLIISVFAMSASNAIAAPPGEVFVNCGPTGANSVALYEAIENADVIKVINVQGMCIGNFVIKKDDVELLAKPNGNLGKLVAADAGMATLLIEANRVVIDGFKSISGGLSSLVVSNAASAKILKNTIEDGVFSGLVVTNNSTVEAVGNIIKNNGRNGLVVANNSNIFAENNEITGNGSDGAIFQRSVSVRLDNNLITGNVRHGIQVIRITNLELGSVFGGAPNIIQFNKTGGGRL